MVVASLRSGRRMKWSIASSFPSAGRAAVQLWNKLGGSREYLDVSLRNHSAAYGRWVGFAGPTTERAEAWKRVDEIGLYVLARRITLLQNCILG